MVSDSNLQSPRVCAQMHAHTLTHMEIPKGKKKREEEESHVQEKGEGNCQTGQLLSERVTLPNPVIQE